MLSLDFNGFFVALIPRSSEIIIFDYKKQKGSIHKFLWGI